MATVSTATGSVTTGGSIDPGAYGWLIRTGETEDGVERVFDFPPRRTAGCRGSGSLRLSTQRAGDPRAAGLRAYDAGGTELPAGDTGIGQG